MISMKKFNNFLTKKPLFSSSFSGTGHPSSNIRVFHDRNSFFKNFNSSRRFVFQYPSHSTPSISTKSSHWSIRRLPNSSVISNHVADPLRAKGFDSRYHTPKWIYSCRSFDFTKPWSELVITEHNNPFENKPELNHLVSVLLFSREGVTQKFLKHFEKTPCSIMFDFQNDLSARLSITGSCKNPGDLLDLSTFLKIVNQNQPFSPQMQQQIDRILDVTPSINSLLEEIPLDEKYNPVYFQHNENTLIFGGAYEQYHPIYDSSISHSIPELHQHILNGNKKAVSILLEKNPNLVYQKDPYGIEAHKLAKSLGLLEIFTLCYQAMQTIPIPSLGTYHLLKNYKIILREWKETGIGIFYFGSKSGVEVFQDGVNKFRDQYLRLIKKPIPVRSALHVACLKGDIESVKNFLNEQPELVESQDPRGFTPLLLALATNNIPLLRWLIEEKKVSLKTVEFQTPLGDEITLRPIDHATSPQAMEIILHYGVDPHEFNNRLIVAIYNNDIAMVEYLLYYLHELPSELGLNAVELAMRLSRTPRYGTKVLELLLMHYEQEVAYGPYDTNIHQYMKDILKDITDFNALLSPYTNNLPEDVAKKLIEHNQRMQKNRERLRNRVIPSSIAVVIPGESISETLKSEENIFQSQLKPIHKLSEQEIHDIKQLFFSNFQMYENNTEVNRNNYINHALEENPEAANTQIYLIYHEKTLVFFLTIEQLAIEQKQVFHFKLGANHKNFSAHAFTDFVFRIPLAYKSLHPKESVLVYFKAIPPGLFLTTFPKHVHFFPKYQYSRESLQKIVEATGESLNHKKIRVKLKVLNTRSSNFKTKDTSYFEHIVGEGRENAMAGVFEFDDDNCSRYRQKLDNRGIGKEHMKTFTNMYDTFTSAPLSKENGTKFKTPISNL